MHFEPFGADLSSLYGQQCIWGYFKFKTSRSLKGQSECANYSEYGTIPSNGTINLLPTASIDILLTTPQPGKLINQAPIFRVKLVRGTY